MSVRIIFRLGSTIPSDEFLDVGEPVFDPDRFRLGVGAGNSQPLWYPRINPINQDLIQFGSSLIQSEAGGERARFGWEAKDQFNVHTFSGLRFRIADGASTFYNRVNLTAGGSLSGDMNTDGGRFTDMNVQEITTSAVTKSIIVRDGMTNAAIGRIDEKGITSLSQQDMYLTLAMWSESWLGFVRNTFSSGVVAARQYNTSRPFDPKYKATTGGFSALSIHNHMDWRGICGMAEISVLVNGHHIQTRHNDYRTMRPLNTAVFGERALNTGAPVPSAIRSLPLGYTGLTLNNNLAGTQVEYMRNVYSPENNKDCIWELSYLEVWVEKFDGNIRDIATSTRHANEVQSASQFMDRILAYNSGGIKPPTENMPMLPGVVMGYDENGHPQLGYVNWRISSIPVGNLSNRNVSAVIDGIGFDLRALPFDVSKAALGIIDATNRFTLRRKIDQTAFKNRAGRIDAVSPNPSEDLLEPNMRHSWENIVAKGLNAMFDCADLEELCRMCPGFDGIGNYDTQFMADPFNAKARGSNVPVRYSALSERGLGYYHNKVGINIVDASGFNVFTRGFSDINLFSAKTKHPDVLGGWSCMIPLELLIRTPRENWNPFNVVQQTVPTGNGSYAQPYSGWNEYGRFFTTPVDALGGVETTLTQADTSNRAWMATPAGAKEMYAAGMRIFDITGERRRFPVVPESIQFTGVGRDLEWFKIIMKGLLKRVASGEITGDEIDGAF